MNATEKFYSSPRGRLFYNFIRSDAPDSDAPTLVMLHGLTADHRLFDRQVEYFAGKYDIIVWDAPAHGRSRPYADFSYPNAASDLRSILDENGVSSAILIGQSMGGFVAQSFLLRWPEYVRAFIGIDTCPYGDGYYSRSDKWWLRQIGWMSKLYPLGLLKSSMANQTALSPRARENMRAMLEPYGKDELCRLMGIGFAGFLEDNREPDIACPTLIIAGEQDRTGKVLQYCREWTKNTGFPLILIPDAAHNSNDDNPEAVNEAIERFINQSC